MSTTFTRRRFLGLGLAGTAVALSGAVPAFPAPADARLQARPGKPTKPAKPGLQELGLAKGRDGFFVVPPSYDPKKPVPVMLFLHGAIGRTEAVESFCSAAARRGIAAVAPDSRGASWDFAFRRTGPDLAFIDRALEHLFARVNADPQRVAIVGFSDGASYALSAGLANGDLFHRIVAFSPGFMQPPGRQGKPSLWVSHGKSDNILPVQASRDRIVPQLKKWGYPVHYREFEGGHDVYPFLASEAFAWLVAKLP